MDRTTIGRGSRRNKVCSSTSTASSRYTPRRPKCARRTANVSANRNCSTWFDSLKSPVGVSTSCRTEESLPWHDMPCDDLFDAALRTATLLAVWSIYRDEIVAWLARNRLQESILGDACLMLEHISARIRATVWVRKKTSAVMVRISERLLNASELQRLRCESPSAYDELMRRGLVRVNIPKLNPDSGIERAPQC